MAEKCCRILQELAECRKKTRVMPKRVTRLMPGLCQTRRIREPVQVGRRAGIPHPERPTRLVCRNRNLGRAIGPRWTHFFDTTEFG